MADLTTTMNALVECARVALADLGDGERAVCSHGLTVGPPAPGPAGCCQCDTTAGGQLSAHLERTYPTDGFTFEPATVINCRPVATAADISLTVLRCYPTLDEQGNMPSLDETTPFADDLNTDLAAVVEAVTCCTGFRLAVREAAIDSDPEGGCSGFAVRVSVMVNL